MRMNQLVEVCHARMRENQVLAGLLVPKLDAEGCAHLMSYVQCTEDENMSVLDKTLRISLVLRIVELSLQTIPPEEWVHLAEPAAELTRSVLNAVRHNVLLMAPGGQQLVLEAASVMLMPAECSASQALREAMSSKNKIPFLRIVTWPDLLFPLRNKILRENVQSMKENASSHDQESLKQLLVVALRDSLDIGFQELIMEFLIKICAHHQYENSGDNGSQISITSYMGNCLNLPDSVMVIHTNKYFSTVRNFLHTLNAGLPGRSRIISLRCLILRVGCTIFKITDGYSPIWLDLSPASHGLRVVIPSKPHRYDEQLLIITFNRENLKEISAENAIRAQTPVVRLTLVSDEPFEIAQVPKNLVACSVQLSLRRDADFLEAEENFFKRYYNDIYLDPEFGLKKLTMSLGPLFDASLSAIDKTSAISPVCRPPRACGEYVVTSTPNKPNHPRNIVVRSAAQRGFSAQGYSVQNVSPDDAFTSSTALKRHTLLTCMPSTHQPPKNDRVGVRSELPGPSSQPAIAVNEMSVTKELLALAGVALRKATVDVNDETFFSISRSGQMETPVSPTEANEDAGSVIDSSTRSRYGSCKTIKETLKTAGTSTNEMRLGEGNSPAVSVAPANIPQASVDSRLRRIVLAAARLLCEAAEMLMHSNDQVGVSNRLNSSLINLALLIQENDGKKRCCTTCFVILPIACGKALK